MPLGPRRPGLEVQHPPNVVVALITNVCFCGLSLCRHPSSKPPIIKAMPGGVDSGTCLLFSNSHHLKLLGV